MNICVVYFLGQRKEKMGFFSHFWILLWKRPLKQSIDFFYDLFLSFLLLQIEAGRKFETFSGEFFRTSGRKMQ